MKPKSFSGKWDIIVLTLYVSFVLLVVAGLLMWLGLTAGAVTMIVLVLVCCPSTLYYVWKI